MSVAGWSQAKGIKDADKNQFCVREVEAGLTPNQVDTPHRINAGILVHMAVVCMPRRVMDVPRRAGTLYEAPFLQDPIVQAEVRLRTLAITWAAFTAYRAER